MRSRPRSRWVAAFALQVLAIAGLAAACGSSSDGAASKDPAAILAASTAAARSARAVHIRSKVAQGRLTATLDLQLTETGGRARVGLAGVSNELLRIGDAVYLRSNPSLRKRFARRGVHLAEGGWVRASAGSAGQLGQLLDMRRELDTLLESTKQLSKVATRTVNGHKTVVLKESGRALSTPTIYISATGTPYPVKIVKQGREHGEVTFTAWNRPVTLAAPVGALPLGALQRAGR